MGLFAPNSGYSERIGESWMKKESISEICNTMIVVNRLESDMRDIRKTSRLYSPSAAITVEIES
jgi:hypothetical protein